jgi:hypothetical protein
MHTHTHIYYVVLAAAVNARGSEDGGRDGMMLDCLLFNNRL